MAKTAAERMRESRARKRNSATPESATSVTKTERNTPSATESLELSNKRYLLSVQKVTGMDIGEEPIGPLDIYSEQRWAFLQSRGHKWDADRQRSTRPAEHGSIVIGVTVPGDPAYQEAS